METVPFRTILHSVLHLMGRDPDSGDFSAPEAAMITSFVNLRMPRAWKWAWWPDLCQVANMSYRDKWVDVTNYLTGREIYNESDDGYYQALTDNVGKQPDESPDDWEVIDALDRYVPYQLLGYSPIGTVHGVYSQDPALFRRATKIQHILRNYGVMVPPSSPNTVWVHYRLPVAVFSSEEYSESKAYAAGARMYFEEDTYKALETTTAGEDPTTTPDKWVKVDFPAMFLPTLVRAAFSDYQRAKGNADKAIMDDRLFEDELMTLADDLAGQGQHDFVNVN